MSRYWRKSMTTHKQKCHNFNHDTVDIVRGPFKYEWNKIANHSHNHNYRLRLRYIFGVVCVDNLKKYEKGKTADLNVLHPFNLSRICFTRRSRLQYAFNIKLFSMYVATVFHISIRVFFFVLLLLRCVIWVQIIFTQA